MKHLTVFFILIFFMVGCAPTTPTVYVMRYTNEVYPPTANVEVLRTNPPDRQYVELGEIEINSKQDNAVQYLVQKAKEMGADAIILMGEKNRGAVAVPIGQMVYAAPVTRLWAIAIKYTVVTDTVRTIFADTQRTVVVDTVRTVLLQVSESDSPRQSVVSAESDSVMPRLVRTALQEMADGRVSMATLRLLTRGIPAYTTTSASSIGRMEFSLLCTLARLDTSEVAKVRWGWSMAPADNPDHKGTFITVWTGTGQKTTVKIDSMGVAVVSKKDGH